VDLFPDGIAWPKFPVAYTPAQLPAAPTFWKVIYGLAQYWGFVDSRAADLLEIETDPRKTMEMLKEWETAFGLPDPCLQEPLTIDARHAMLVQRMTMLGAQSKDWFKEVASWLGYTITIGEYAPWIVGISRCGGTLDDEGNPRWQIAPPEIRFYWTVHVDQAKLTWFRCGAGECGVDPHLIIGLATDLECLLNRWKPAHTAIIYDYSGLSTGGSMAGTP
jgi:uncharacterized protein YmfQ (DUF2313 family)